MAEARSPYAELARRLKEEASVDYLLRAGRKWEAIRAFYDLNREEIMDRRCSRFEIDIYGIDWINIFTPIERLAWSDIRDRGVPLYPQYPIAGVFVDFGDPVMRVALECDGQAYHDPVKDAVRDAMLNTYGWQVYRVTGAECYREDTPGRRTVGSVLDTIIRNHYRDLPQCQTEY